LLQDTYYEFTFYFRVT